LKCSEANFAGANLREANLQAALFNDASLKDADLTQADFRYAMLRGTDLRGAKLDEAMLDGVQYDESTRLPQGFVPPPEMVWKGKKLPSALLQTVAASTAPMDFDAFFKQLPSRVAADRLAKALQMLKADRFHLFGDVTDDFLRGVVRSQSDT